MNMKNTGNDQSHENEPIEPHYRTSINLGALEASWDALPTVIQKQAQRDWHVQIDPQNVGLKSRAEAHSSFKINKTLNEAAAWGLWRGAHDKVHQVIQQIGTNP